MKIFGKLLLVFLWVPCVSASDDSVTVQSASSLTQNITVAVVTAFLSLLVGYTLFRIQQRKAPKRRLTYDINTRMGLVAVEDSVAGSVSVSYKGESAEALSYVECCVQNSGTLVVKNQRLRFDFGEGSKVLESLIDPLPPIEYGVERKNDTTNSESELSYSIAHLEVGQSVSFGFVLSEMNQPEPDIHPFNEVGDVEFIATSTGRIRTDIESVEDFFALMVIFVIAAPVLSFMPGYLGDLLVSVVYAFLAASIILVHRPVAHVLAQIIVNLGNPAKSGVAIDNVYQNEGSHFSIYSESRQPKATKD